METIEIKYIPTSGKLETIESLTQVQCGFCNVWGTQTEIYQHLQDDHVEEDMQETEESNGIECRSDFEPVTEEASSNQRQNGKLEWDSKESQFLLSKYNEYVCEVGIHKMFRSKKCMYKRIALDLKNELQIERTWEQCENRYKTIKRRKKRDYESRNVQFIGSIIDADFDDTEYIEHVDGDVILDNTRLSKNRRDDDSVTETLKEIHKRKEMGKQQRHTEKLEMFSGFCKSLLGNEFGEDSRENGQVLFDEIKSRKRMSKKCEKSISEILLEIHEKKEENKERRHKEKLQLFSKFYTEFLARVNPNNFEAITIDESMDDKDI